MEKNYPCMSSSSPLLILLYPERKWSNGRKMGRRGGGKITGKEFKNKQTNKVQPDEL